MNAIVVEQLSKRYVIGHLPRHDTLRDAIMARLGFLARGSHLASDRRPSQEEFWALRDVSFSVAPGEVLGIVGRNGAGKSTLLKILSRITEPTSGRVRLHGRVASLLEVGTGFHPELTGRENIQLNGAILGMSRVEVRKNFDAIVAFAEIARFLDTPVKHYSSGMYVRLAFAVAAHLEPEILIIDEVLAVGDAAFQKKCLSKMRQVSANEGRTVLFVSHNIQAVRQLCSRALLLENGQVNVAGTTSDVIAAYVGNSERAAADLPLCTYPRTKPAEALRLQRVGFRSDDGTPIIACDRRHRIHVEVELAALDAVAEFDLAMAVGLPDGTQLCSEVLSDRFERGPLRPGTYTCSFAIPASLFKVGAYSLTLAALHAGGVADLVEGVALPEITDAASDQHTESHRWGVLRLPVVWQSVQRQT